MSLYPARSPLPLQQQIEQYLQLSIQVADKAAAAGNHPFGSVLLDEKGEVLMEQGNVNTVQHAEVELARRACEDIDPNDSRSALRWAGSEEARRLTLRRADKEYTPEQLWTYTLVTNFEPCAMCTGSIYW
jgi:tRNA(Arg) A34 adenosine deaminase TadA